MVKKISIWPLDLRSLALFRILLGTLVCLDAINRWWFLREFLTDVGVMPRVVLSNLNWDNWRFVLHNATGNAFGMNLLLAVHLLFGLFLILGFRTRLSSIVCWVLTLSVQSRNPLVNQGGDVYFRLLLLFSAFLPVGAMWSWDRAVQKVKQPIVDFEWSSVFASVLTVQVFFVYAMSSILKIAHVSWREHVGAYYAFSAWFLASSTGMWISKHMALCQWINDVTLYGELLLPLFLLLSPRKFPILRIVSIVVMWAFHVGTFFSFHIGLFPLIGITAWTIFIPSQVWSQKNIANYVEKISAFFSQLFPKVQAYLQPKMPSLFYERQGTLFYAKSWGASLFGLFVLYNIVGSNMYHFPFGQIGKGYRDTIVSSYLGLDQKWDMFSIPIVEDGWFVIPARLHDGTLVDLLQDGKPMSWEQPKVIATTMKGDRWRKYLFNIVGSDKASFRRYLGAYYCILWNETHFGNSSLEALEIIFMRQSTLEFGGKAEVKKLSLWQHECMTGMVKKWTDAKQFPFTN